MHQELIQILGRSQTEFFTQPVTAVLDRPDRQVHHRSDLLRTQIHFQTGAQSQIVGRQIRIPLLHDPEIVRMLLLEFDQEQRPVALRVEMAAYIGVDFLAQYGCCPIAVFGLEIVDHVAHAENHIVAAHKRRTLGDDLGDGLEDEE